MAKQFPAKKGQPPVDQVPPTDVEDQDEASETPGETPDAEDVQEGVEAENEAQDEGDDSSDESGDDAGRPPAVITDDKPNVTADEQRQYDTVVTLAMHMMFDPHGIQVLVQKLQAGKDNISGAIGHTAAMIMQSVRATVMQQGKEISDDVLYAAGQEVIGDLCDIAVGAKIMPNSMVQKVASAALFEGMRVWGATMANRGDITPDVQQQAQADLKAHGIKQAQPNAQPQGQAGQPAQPAQPPGAGGALSPGAMGIVNQAAGA
jgi:hypothetical protein